MYMHNVLIGPGTLQSMHEDKCDLNNFRLTNKIFVDLPSADGRIDILHKLTRNGTRPPLAPEIDLAQIGRDQRCEGFSGADLGNLVHRAAQARMEEMLLALDKDDSSTTVSERHFEKAFQWVKPSVRGRQKRRYDEMRRIYQEEMESMIGVKRAKTDADDSSKHSEGALEMEASEPPASPEKDSVAGKGDLHQGVGVGRFSRYLPDMIVRVKDSSHSGFGGRKGRVVRISDDGAYVTLAQSVAPPLPGAPVEGEETINVLKSDLEHFTPKVGDRTKLLIQDSVSESATVMSIDNDEKVTLRFDGDPPEMSPISLDYLCVVEDREEM